MRPRLPASRGKGPPKGAVAWEADRLNALGGQGWEAIGLSHTCGDLMAWPVVLFERPLD